MRLPLVVLLLAATTPTLLAQGTSRGVQLFESRDRAGARAEFFPPPSIGTTATHARTITSADRR